METYKACFTPFVVILKFSNNDGEKLSNLIVHRNMIGKLHYLTTTRPNSIFLASLLL